MKKIKKIINTFIKKYGDIEGLPMMLMNMLVLNYLRDSHRLNEAGYVAAANRESFSLKATMTAWKDAPLSPWEDWGELPTSPVAPPLWMDICGFLDGEESLDDHAICDLGALYELSMAKIARKKGGVFYTPPALAHYMARSLLKMTGPAPVVLDPACGSGALLMGMYHSLAACGEITHRDLLEKHLWGMELDPGAARVTRAVLALQDKTYYYPLHIVVGDALRACPEAWHRRFDAVIANPPYMGHKAMAGEDMEDLRRRYPQVYGDKGDVSYCFFEGATPLVKAGGALAFLTARYYLEALNAYGLRIYLSKNCTLLRIVDFNGIRPIPGVGVDPALLFFRAAPPATHGGVQVEKFKPVALNQPDAQACVDDLDQDHPKGCRRFTLLQATLGGEPWRLNDSVTQTILKKIEEKAHLTLKDGATSFQGVITGRDKVFVMTQEMAEQRGFDSTYLHPWIKGRHLHSYEVTPSQEVVLTLNHLKTIEGHQELMDYLNPHRKSLEKRRECQRGVVPWYGLQWPRNPNHFQGEKIIFPYKAPKNRFALDAQGNYFSADIYGMIPHHLDGGALVTLLNSSLYDFYFKAFGKKLGMDLYEYYPNTVMCLKIPSSDDQIYCELKPFYDIIISLIENNKKEECAPIQRAVNQYLYTYFNLSAEEIVAVEKR